MAKLTISPFSFDIPCEVYGCTNRARHVIGPENMQTANNLYICDECYKSLVKQVLEMEKPEPIAVKVKDEEPKAEAEVPPTPEILKPKRGRK